MRKLILFCILAIGLLLIISCKPAEEPEEPEAPETGDDLTPPSMPEETTPTPTPETPTKMLSGLKCMDDKIEAVVANTKDETIELTNTAKIIVNGLIVSDPECDKLTLAPGESTICSDISGHLSIKQGQVNEVQLNLLREKVIEYIDCAVE